MVKQENTEQKGRGYDFYVGVVVGVIGNLFVSSFVEWSSSIWEHKALLLLIQWSIMLLISSTALFQLSKMVMGRYVSSKKLARNFDIVTIFCDTIAILSIVLAVLALV